MEIITAMTKSVNDKCTEPKKVQVAQTRGDLRVIELSVCAISESVQPGETLTWRTTADELHFVLARKIFMLKLKSIF